MTLNGIPLHPLVVHAAVVLTPLAALLGLAVALVPRWRWATRWPFAVTALAAGVSSWLAGATGEDLQHKLHLHSALMETHETWAGRMQAVTWVLAGAAVLALFVLPHVTPWKADATGATRAAALRIPLAVVLVVLAVGVLYAAYQTGDAGARLVWQAKG